MILPIKRGTARRLGIRPPCPCMAQPVRIMFAHDPGTDYEAAVHNFLSMKHNITTLHEDATVTRRRCDGTCPVAGR